MIDRSTPPTAHDILLRSIRPETVSVLDNGLAFHRFNGGDQPICTLQLLFAGGMAETGNDIFTRVTLNALADGTMNLSPDEVADIMDYYGIKLRAACHGHYTSLTITALSERLPAFLPTLTEIMTAPAFPPDRLRTMLLSAKAQLETSRREIFNIADEAFDSLIMGEDNPMARTITPEEVITISREDIASLYSRLMCPSRAHAYFSGLYDDSTENATRDFLCSLPAQSDGFEPIITSYRAAPAGRRRNIAFSGTLQNAIVTGLPAVGRNHPDYNALRLTVMALGGYFGSRLMTNIREEKGLTYGISASLLGTHEGAYVKIAAQCDRANTETVLTEISNELKGLVTSPPQGDELKRLRMHAYTALARTLDTPDSIMGYYATRQLAGTPDDYFEAQKREIEALTSSRIADIASRYLMPEELRTVVAGE